MHLKKKHLLYAAGLTTVLLMVYTVLPIRTGLMDISHVCHRVYTDASGQPLRELLNVNEERGSFFEADDRIPPKIVLTMLAAEDHRFYTHYGFDPTGILRAMAVNTRNRHLSQGGSTLTQQLVRKLITRRKSLRGKFLEVLDAVRYEIYFSKDEILRGYLNHVSFGNQIIGMKRAAMVYFNKDVEYLSWAEISFLMAIPMAPAANNPWHHIDRTRARQRRILKRLHNLEFIDADILDLALSEEISINRQFPSFHAPHFIRYIEDTYPDEIAAETRVQTTIDYSLQEEVQNIVAQTVSRLSDKNLSAAACVVLDNASGEVLAWVGSADFFDKDSSGQVDGVISLRQPGSSLKPFTYLLALDRGWHPACILPDIRLSFSGPSGIFEPVNYNRVYHGPIRFREALGNSLNVPAVYLLNELGVGSLKEVLLQAGLGPFSQEDEFYGLGLTLGNAEVRLLDLANAYRTLANNGTYSPVICLEQSEPVSPTELWKVEHVMMIKHILSDPQARKMSFGNARSLMFSFPVAVKTGTSQGFRNNIAVGFTDQYTVAAWAGNFDNSPMHGVSGISGAGPIFYDVLNELNRREGQNLTIDEDIFLRMDICAVSGRLPGRHCKNVISECFLQDTHPKQKCSWHKGTGTELPELYSRWLRYSAGPEAGGEYRLGKIRSFSILSPAEGDIFIFNKGEGRLSQGISLEVSQFFKDGCVTWYVNGQKLHSSAWPFRYNSWFDKGRYMLYAEHSSGKKTAPVTFFVR